MHSYLEGTDHQPREPMNDAIYLREGDELVEMTAEPYEYESVLQEKLAAYPKLLAGGEMADRGIDRWALVAREKAVPDREGGAQRWSADHLFVDQDGVPTIVEVKRGANTEVRRKIVGQMLDYVAHASLYWDATALEDRFVETCGELDVSPEETLARLVGDDDPAGFWEDVEKNLRSKEIRLVFVADEVPSELRRVVEFLNEAMQEVEVLAIEVVQYVSDDKTIFVPRIHGQTEEAKASSTSASRTGSDYVETEAELYADLDQKLQAGEITDEVHDAFIDLYEFSTELGDEVDIGGAKNANFGLQVDAHQGDHVGSPSVFTANVSGKVKVWPAKMPLDDEQPDASPIAWDPVAYEEFLAAFESLDGVPPDENVVSFDTLASGDSLEEFKRSVEVFVTHCREAAAE